LTETEAKTPKGLQKISRQAQGKSEEILINYLMLRSLREARYSSNNAGHFGLAADCYTHFTSPIRRYPDLAVHRIVRTLKQHGAKAVAGTYGEQLETVAEHCSLREREAMEAERESLQMKQLLFMSGKVGEVFEGRITGVHSYGLFVQIIENLAEGLVHVSSLEDDYYAFIEEQHSLIGENTGKVYRLGDKAQVQVVRVDLDRRRMDFVFVGEEEVEGRGRTTKKKSKRVEYHIAARGKKAAKKAATGKKGKRRRR